jgi:hypothetical protein
MRLSMLEHEEQQRKQAEAKKKEEEAAKQKAGQGEVSLVRNSICPCMTEGAPLSRQRQTLS